MGISMVIARNFHIVLWKFYKENFNFLELYTKGAIFTSTEK